MGDWLVGWLVGWLAGGWSEQSNGRTPILAGGMWFGGMEVRLVGWSGQSKPTTKQLTTPTTLQNKTGLTPLNDLTPQPEATLRGIRE